MDKVDEVVVLYSSV